MVTSFNVSKCEALLISNKRRPMSFKYFVNHSPLAWRSAVKYLGVLLRSNLSWSDHCKHVSAKASKATTEVKSMTYRCLVAHYWSIRARFGALTLFQTRPHWNLSSGMQHVGYVEVTGLLCENIGVNLRMFVYESYIGLLFRHDGTT